MVSKNSILNVALSQLDLEETSKSRTGESKNLFRSVWRKLRSKRALWEEIRAFFMNHKIDSMTQIYRALLYSFEFQTPKILNNTS